MSLIYTRSIEGFDTLRAAIARFNDWWPAHVVHIEVYAIPLHASERAPLEIPVTRVVGEAAVDLTREALAQFAWQAEQHLPTTFRLPGVVALDACPCPQLRRINAIKTRLKRDIHREIKAHARPAFHARVFPGCAALQVYRRIHGLAISPRRIGLIWAGKTHAIKLLAPDEAKALVTHYARDLAHALPGVNKEQVLQMEYDKIEALRPDQVLKIREPIAPHPRATIYEHGVKADRAPDAAPGTHRRGHSRMLHANLPIFYHQSPALPPAVIGPLKDWFAADRSQRPPALPLARAVVPSCHLYVAQRPPARTRR